MKEAKKVGEYEATVHFHKEVEVKVPVTVVAENAPVAAPVEEKKEEAPVVEAPVVEAPVVEEAPVAEAPAEEEAPAEA
jgi:large subunit ribosomal protein L9